MPRALKKLYDSFYSRPRTTGEQQRIEHNSVRLKQNFNKHQRKLLLRIIDGKDLICDIISQDSIEQGFRLGMKIATETYQEKDGISDEFDFSDEPLSLCQEEKQ